MNRRGLALSDHFVTMVLSYPHLWVALTELAYATRVIPITSSFANNLFRSSVEFAEAALTLNRVANGRFEGLGIDRVQIAEMAPCSTSGIGLYCFEP